MTILTTMTTDQDYEYLCTIDARALTYIHTV